MTRKIFQSMIAVVVSVLLLSLALITGVLYEHFESAMLDQMRTTASFVEQGVKEDGMKYLDEMSSSPVPHHLDRGRRHGKIRQPQRPQHYGKPRRPGRGEGGAGKRVRHQYPPLVHPVGAYPLLRQADAGRHGAASRHVSALGAVPHGRHDLAGWCLSSWRRAPLPGFCPTGCPRRS